MPLHRDIMMTQEFKKIAAAAVDSNDGPRQLCKHPKQPSPKKPSPVKPRAQPQPLSKKKKRSRGRPPGKSKKKGASGQRQQRRQVPLSQSSHSSLVSESDSSFEKDRPLIKFGRRRREQKKKEKKQSKKRKRRLASSIQSDSDDSDVPLSSYFSGRKPTRQANFVDDDVVYHNDSLLELARKTRLSQSSHKSKKPHIIEEEIVVEIPSDFSQAPADGEFSIANILSAMEKDTTLYGNNADCTKYIKQLEYNNKQYEGTFWFDWLMPPFFCAFSCF